MITVEPAALLPWSALETVLASTGESRHCWCRWWLTTNAEYDALTDDERRAQAHDDHASHEPRGLLARRTGVARALLTAAIAHATAGGASRIEAYPVDTDAPTASGRPPSSDDLNTGTLRLFTAAGFVEVARPKPTRPIVQLTLADATVRTV